MPAKSADRASLDTSADRYQRIYATIAKIPPGRVASYGQIAELSGLPRGARMVGRALRLSPADVELPWHRVLRADGAIAFPKDSAAFEKQRDRLLDEGVAVIRGRVNLSKFRWNALDELLWGPE